MTRHPHSTPTLRWLPVVAAMAVTAACATPGPATDQQPFSASGGSTLIGAVDSAYGRVLVDGTGHALYQWVPASGTSAGAAACEGSCTATWPPYIAGGVPAAADATLNDLSTALLGTVTRPDGGSQVAYHGRALYLFAGDKAAGQTRGEGSAQAGGTWLLVSTDGTPVRP
jgi:predicted lipoprotein with Yx(FWY)xxD motif